MSIFVIDDDEIMAECIMNAVSGSVKTFTNALAAMEAISEGHIPDVIFLDILLDGPDGFTFLNELASYADTSRIPVVVVSSIEFGEKDLSVYGVVGVLNKNRMRPEDIKSYAEKYSK